MTTNCVGPSAITSGANLTGLTQGTGDYVTVTASASTGYLVSPASAAAGPSASTVQLTAPTGVTLAYGTVAGSIKVTFTAPGNAAAGQLYTATACTGAGMTGTCVGPSAITTGGNLTGLNYTLGAAGTSYYVTVTANASPGYLASPASAIAGPRPPRASSTRRPVSPSPTARWQARSR